MKILKCTTVILLYLFTFQISFAQNTETVRQEVLNRLKKLKPANPKNYVYKLAVPRKTPALPKNLRLDIVYKIGHYDFQYIALRFEMEKSEGFVRVTRFVYGSALNFWKKYSEYSKGDAYSATEGKLAVKDFNDLLNLAYTLYQSNIEKKYLESKMVKPKTKSGRRAGSGSGSGLEGTSRTGSSGDGSIIINLSDQQNISASIINETGTLHADNLKNRISNGFEDLRIHLFWEVFHDYFEKNNIFADLEHEKAEEIAISRLEEPQFNKNYTDYYRQSLYVEILGAIGTAKALPILKKLVKQNGLEKDWDKYLSEDTQKAIEKINSREKPQTE